MGVIRLEHPTITTVDFNSFYLNQTTFIVRVLIVQFKKLSSPVKHALGTEKIKLMNKINQMQERKTDFATEFSSMIPKKQSTFLWHFHTNFPAKLLPSYPNCENEIYVQLSQLLPMLLLRPLSSKFSTSLHSGRVG